MLPVVTRYGPDGLARMQPIVREQSPQVAQVVG